jgi:DNA polymerase-4
VTQDLHHWKRAIALADMNAFFCSIEQMDNPEWQGRPIGVTNGEIGTCVITSSYEARAFGVRTGMRVKEAKSLCPGFIQVPARPERYAEVSSNIMGALSAITPDIEIFSVDEAFLDVTRCQKLYGSPERIAEMIKQVILDVSGGLLCSVGMSGDKTTAKFAAKQHKPNGLTVIPPWDAKAVLAGAKVTDLCGVARGIGGYLAERGVDYCCDMQHLPISELGRRFGNPGRRIWLMCQGLDPEPVIQSVPAPKSIGHGKIMPPGTKDLEVIKIYLIHMAAKVAGRLRRHQYHASHFFIGLRTAEGWLGGKYRCNPPTNDTNEITKLSYIATQLHWHGEGVYQVQITALDPQPSNQQTDLFATDRAQQSQLNQAIDAINYRYGEFALAPARLLRRSSMPNVIAPAWKPYGHRETILKR